MLIISRRRYLWSGLMAMSSMLFGQISWAAANRKLFDAGSSAAALQTLAEKDAPELSRRLMLAIPEISADPSHIAVHIRSELPGTDMMILMATSITPPVVAQFMIPVGTEADIQTMIKLTDTTTMQLVVRAGGKLYFVQKEVKIAKPLDNKLLSE